MTVLTTVVPGSVFVTVSYWVSCSTEVVVRVVPRSRGQWAATAKHVFKLTWRSRHGGYVLCLLLNGSSRKSGSRCGRRGCKGDINSRCLVFRHGRSLKSIASADQHVNWTSDQPTWHIDCRHFCLGVVVARQRLGKVATLRDC